MVDAPRGDDPAQDPAVMMLKELSVEETLLVYAELVEDVPDKADVAALALREEGRAGRLAAEHVEVLAACVEMAPNSLCVGHLAKALATLGRRATGAASSLMARMEPMVVTDDCEYWSFDACVWALGYLGGADVGPFLSALEREDPSRVVRSQSIYTGAMGTQARQQRFAAALAGARGLLAQADPGVWRTSFMTVKRVTATGQRAGKAWDVRPGKGRGPATGKPAK
ncbi:MAG: hypothetical protein HY903_19650 [Deltaproteobacteria bacterium]|nr:hypothetical protein [Deltaproteobacteria bacterium]